MIEVDGNNKWITLIQNALTLQGKFNLDETILFHSITQFINEKIIGD